MSGGPPWSRPGAAGPAPRSDRWSPPGTTIPAEETTGGGATVLVTVVAPGGGRTSTRVPADVPVARLAPGLGAAVNVANVSDLDDDNGTRLSGTSSLTEAGMRDGSTVHVVAPGITPRAAPDNDSDTDRAAAPSRLGPSAPWGPTRDAAERGVTPDARSSRGNIARLPVAIGAAVIAAVVLFALGGVVLGSGSTEPGPGPIARRAVAAWLDARPFTGPLAPGVPATLGRTGTIHATTVQSAGQWHHGAQAGETFIVVPAPSTATDKTSFTVTVVTRNGKVEFPPAVSLLPVVNGRMPPAPGGSKVTNGGPLPGAVAAWSQDQFGPKGVQPPGLQLGLTGDPTVVASWSPEAGGSVFRLRLPLDSLAPGTASAKLIGADQALAAKVTTDTTGVQADQAGLTQAQAQARSAQQAAATANPPNPPPLAAAFASANSAAIAAAQRLTADTAALKADQDAEAKAASQAHSATRTTAVATYDVWMRAQAVVGWAPAAYGVTG